MAKARDVPGLSPSEPYAAAAARVVAVRAEELREHSDGILDLGEIENVHDMRVATRRLRAALEVFEPCFPRKRHKRALREVKAMADALGERRDRDVAIDAMASLGKRLPAADRAGIDSLVAELRAEQMEANRVLGEEVTDQRVADLVERLDELCGEAAD